MALRLPDTVSSGQDLNSLIVDVHEYLKWYSHESIKKRSGSTKKSDAPNISEGANDLIRQWNDSRDKLEELVQTLEDIHRNSKLITITLADQPSGGVKKKLVAWCRKEIAPDILVNFSVNNSLLGGLVVRAGSRVFDMSFRREILANKAHLGEVLRRV